MRHLDKPDSIGQQPNLRRAGRLRALAPVLAILAAGALAGCAVHADPYYYPQNYPQGVHIPPGHLPPPGKCRVWYPDRPPGHQGPIGKCSKLQYQVPPGAILVRG